MKFVRCVPRKGSKCERESFFYKFLSFKFWKCQTLDIAREAFAFTLILFRGKEKKEKKISHALILPLNFDAIV